MVDGDLNDANLFEIAPLRGVALDATAEKTAALEATAEKTAALEATALKTAGRKTVA